MSARPSWTGPARQPDGAPLVPEFAVRELARSPRLRRLAEGRTGLPGIRCFEAPGHSPHHLVFVLDGGPPTIFSADVAKNRAELAAGKADLTMDAAAHAASIARLNAVWRERPGTVLLPGHDLPLVLDHSGRPAPVGRRELTHRGLVRRQPGGPDRVRPDRGRRGADPPPRGRLGHVIRSGSPLKPSAHTEPPWNRAATSPGAGAFPSSSAA